MHTNRIVAMVMGLVVTAEVAARQGDVVWFDGKHAITYSVAADVEPVVTTALEMWKDDMRQVTGMVPVAAKDRKAKVRVEKGSGAKDGFRIRAVDDQIVVEGNNGRGMAYGLLELSRMAGVSPWIWWGDVVPERKSRLSVPDGYSTEQQPSVEYRGIFLNDEDWSLRPWSSKTHDRNALGTIGAGTYKRICQLLLRLRGNALWPAMHEGTTAFFKTPGAKAVADSCGIVIGSSHCEPLLRNNVGEWDVKERGAFNYRTNRDAVQQYWAERLKEVKGDNVMFTTGMRGIHDSSMEGYKTMPEKQEGLQQVIDDQQGLLRQYVGEPSELMQVFVPYKEVLQLYEMGLRVPDYVTLMWCDDNYGYLTRLSDAGEQQRRGGAGVYYHLSYWGRPHDYLWLTTTQPGLIWNEMREAYDHGVRRLWIANVHDPKVAGYDLELFLDMAWNIESLTPSPSPKGEGSKMTLEQHLERWLCRQFGREAGERLFPAMHEFYRLCGVRRPEFMGWTQVELDKKRYHRGLSPVGDVALTPAEAAARLADFERISRMVADCRQYVRPELSDALFAAIEYPVWATAAMNRKILGDSVESHRAYEEIQALTARYDALGGGKWHGLMDAAPRRLPVFEDVRGRLMVQGEGFKMRNACDYAEASEGVRTVQMLGHSMQAVALPKGGWLTYRFDVAQDGDYRVRTALVPTQPMDNGDLRYSVAIDDGEPVAWSLKEPFRSERWKLNVLDGQTSREVKVRLTKGRHTMTIRALDEHIVVDQWSVE